VQFGQETSVAGPWLSLAIPHHIPKSREEGRGQSAGEKHAEGVEGEEKKEGGGYIEYRHMCQKGGVWGAWTNGTVLQFPLPPHSTVPPFYCPHIPVSCVWW